MTRSSGLVSAALGIAFWAAPLQASAQNPKTAAAPRVQNTPNVPGFAFREEALEGVLATAAVLSNATSFIPAARSDWGPDTPHPFDPWVSGVSDFTGSYGGVSWGLGLGYAFEAAHLADAGVRHGAGIHALRQVVVEVEAALFTRAAVEAMKRLTGRCRPRHFVDGKCLSETRDAFPSGHVAPMAALAGTRFINASLSAGPSGFRWAAFGLAESLALITAALRVEAGAHSLSDVTFGFLVGHAIGTLIAFAHPMTPVATSDLDPFSAAFSPVEKRANSFDQGFTLQIEKVF